MLHSLKIKNFYSFREEQKFSLLGTKSTSKDQRFMTTPSGKNVARIAMIYGANASGKTNFLKAFSFLSWFIQYSWRNLSQNEHFSFMPFVFTDNEKTTSFEIVVESHNGHIYTYSLELTLAKIYKESLKIQKEGKGRHVYLFSRTNDNIKVYESAKFSMNENVATLVRSNASFISTLLQTNIDVFSDFVSAMVLKSNVQFWGRTQKDVHSCIDILVNNDDIRCHVEDFIKKSDTGISRIEIKEFKVEEEDERKMLSLLTKNLPNIPSLDTAKSKFSFYEVSTIHIINNLEYKFSFELESNGTQQVISFLAEALSILQQGGIFVYDELEHGIHPLLIQQILDLFYDEATNPRRSQLICTCHATDALNFLHKRQIFFTEKNETQESCIFRLSDIAGVRNDDNIMQKYLSGVYGGVPYI